LYFDQGNEAIDGVAMLVGIYLAAGVEIIFFLKLQTHLRGESALGTMEAVVDNFCTKHEKTAVCDEQNTCLEQFFFVLLLCGIDLH
jgi:hypothetical protein